ncbi:MAG: molybdopterin molybdotransferase MoeA [Candidatus Acidiferrales bacterium]
MTLSYEEARQKVVDVALLFHQSQALRAERVDLNVALGRVLAREIASDRDYPPFDRSTRDGYALRSADLKNGTKSFRVAGQVRAGTSFAGEVAAGQAVHIMTGAPVPRGADAVLMLEHVRRVNEEIFPDRVVAAGQNIVPAGSEARRGQILLAPGTRLGYAELALSAQVGQTRLEVHRRPRVAILSTGDEVVAVDRQPGPFEIRNSNSVSLSAQAALAGAEPIPLGNAPDRAPELRKMIEHGLASDILVLSGGVSMGEFDLVEDVLRELGAEFFFDAVNIRPGRPAVFGRCREKLVFGLPGNPVSTMVTFELFVVPAIDALAGLAPRPLPLFKARLTKALDEKPGLAHFVPALVTWREGDPLVESLPWQGSGDVVAVAKANCFLFVPETKLQWAAGEWVNVLPRRGVF